jgi:hypothetical protein
MGLSDQVMLARDGDFQDRVAMAAVIAAQAVSGEDQGTRNAGQATLRGQLATSVLNNVSEHTQAFAWSVAANPAITAGSSDSDIQYTVNSVWDDVSGASAF